MIRFLFFFFQAEDGIRDAQESRGLGDVYKRQIPDRRGCAPAAAPTHPTLRRRSPPQHGRRRNLALVPPAAASDRHPPAAAPTERFRNIEPDPRAAGWA